MKNPRIQLVGVPEFAATRLRPREGWDEGTTSDVLGEVLHVYPAHVKKALGSALMSGKF